MNIEDLHQARSEAIDAQVQSLHHSIQKDTSRLERQQEQDEAYTKLQEEQQKTNGEKNRPNSDWTDVYDKWNNWSDVEEVQTNIAKAKKKLSRFKKNNEKTKRKNKHSGSSSPFCCSSSQNRSVEREVVKMTTKERLKHMRSFRCDHGNAEFDKGNFKEACKWYDKSLIYYEYCFMSSGKEKEEVEEERLLCLLNTAACYLSLERYKDCIAICTEAMGLSNTSKSSNSSSTRTVKALFRRAKAYRLLQDFQKAGDDLSKARVILSSTKSDCHVEALDKESDLLALAIDKYESNSVAFAKRMMGTR